MILHLHQKIVQTVSSRTPAVVQFYCTVFLRSLNKIHDYFDQAMSLKGWPVSFSIGAGTYGTVPSSVDEIIRHVDELMYTVKHGGKNRLLHKEIREVTHGKGKF